jgi:hypothetical protein
LFPCTVSVLFFSTAVLPLFRVVFPLLSFITSCTTPFCLSPFLPFFLCPSIPFFLRRHLHSCHLKVWTRYGREIQGGPKVSSPRARSTNSNRLTDFWSILYAPWCCGLRRLVVVQVADVAFQFSPVCGWR